MTEEMKKELEHDLIIMKAKFLLTLDFATIKNDIEVLAEAGLILPMLIYCASASIPPNEIIDNIIATFPDLTLPELVIADQLDKLPRDVVSKAKVRHSRKFKGVFMASQDSDSESMLKVLKESTVVLDNIRTEKLLSFFDRIVKNPKEDLDMSVVVSFASLLKRNVQPPFSAYEALMGVANQPYSKFYQLQVEARNIYFNKDEDSSESV